MPMTDEEMRQYKVMNDLLEQPIPNHSRRVLKPLPASTNKKTETNPLPFYEGNNKQLPSDIWKRQLKLIKEKLSISNLNNKVDFKEDQKEISSDDLYRVCQDVSFALAEEAYSTFTSKFVLYNDVVATLEENDESIVKAVEILKTRYQNILQDLSLALLRMNLAVSILLFVYALKQSEILKSSRLIETSVRMLINVIGKHQDLVLCFDENVPPSNYIPGMGIDTKNEATEFRSLVGFLDDEHGNVAFPSFKMLLSLMDSSVTVGHTESSLSKIRDIKFFFRFGVLFDWKKENTDAAEDRCVCELMFFLLSKVDDQRISNQLPDWRRQVFASFPDIRSHMNADFDSSYSQSLASRIDSIINDEKVLGFVRDFYKYGLFLGNFFLVKIIYGLLCVKRKTKIFVDFEDKILTLTLSVTNK